MKKKEKFIDDFDDEYEDLYNKDYELEEDIEFTEDELKEYLKDLPPEVWEPIKSFEGLYSVSNFGSVRNDRTGKLLKSRVNPYAPWKDIYFIYKNGKRYSYSVDTIFKPYEPEEEIKPKEQKEPVRSENGKINPFI